MDGSITRYVPSRLYPSAAAVAAILAIASVWSGLRWPPAFAATALFALSAAGLLYLAARPAIEIYKTHLMIGKRRLLWSEIRRVDQTGWLSPLVLRITLSGGAVVHLVYPGDLDSAHSLLRAVRRGARVALIDGTPYAEYWDEPGQPASAASLPKPSCQVIPPEEEAEIERLFQRLKEEGTLDPKKSHGERYCSAVSAVSSCLRLRRSFYGPLIRPS